MSALEFASCPICSEAARLYDVVDFNKSCVDPSARQSGLSGIPIYYHQCENCHFLFSQECYAWSREEFAKNVYNSDYILFDPDFASSRPLANAQLVEQMYGNQKSGITHLDFGGGVGILSKSLRDLGWTTSSYDPYFHDQTLPKNTSVDLITAFEVFEHSNTISDLCKTLSALLKPKGAILFSTLLSDGKVLDGERLSWWYAAPRNGHISLFSKKSLELLAIKFDFKFVTYNENFHCFYRDGMA